MIVMKQHIPVNDVKRKDMKGNLFNRFICLVRGHEWIFSLRTVYIDPFDLGDAIPRCLPCEKCARCGKIKEEEV